MGSLYFCNAPTAATAATDAHAILEIWNPSSTRTISLLELAIFFRAGAPAAGAGFVTRRSTAKGTPATTVTPTAENHARREAAPDSAFTLEASAFSVQPTLVSGELYPAWGFAAVQNSGLILPIQRGLEIPPSTGLCFVNAAAVAFAAAEWGVLIEEL